MKRLFALLSLYFTALYFMVAVTTLSPNTLNFLAQYNSASSKMKNGLKSRIKCIDNVNTVQAFIEINDSSVLPLFVKHGVVINTILDNFITADIPVTKINELAAIKGVKLIDISNRAYLANDKSRTFVNMDAVQKGSNLPQKYLGDGVIYGTFDTGVDFNHISFKDSLGNNRILWAYLPTDFSGPKSDGLVFENDNTIGTIGQLPGSVYSAEQIKDLTTDTTGETHGTHTIGTAAGSFYGNPYYGMAPNSSIIACASSDLSDVNIANAVSFIMSKATEANKPVAINLSLASSIGPHDGSSVLSRILDSQSGVGKLIFVSAGNEGDIPLHLFRNFEEDTTRIRTFVQNIKGSYSDITNGNSYPSMFCVWSQDMNKFTITFTCYDVTRGNVVYHSSPFTPENEGNSITLSSDSDNNFANYFDGMIVASGSVSNGKANSLTSISVKSKSPNYYLGLEISSKDGAKINCWTDSYSIQWNDGGVAGYVAGDSNSSISDMATGRNVISVGADISRLSFKPVEGDSIRFDYYTPINGIASFSSYGPSASGEMKPEVVAPGFFVISGYSEYIYPEMPLTSLPYSKVIDGHLQRWWPMWGTSMASPCVAGAVCTWLQVNPTLTSGDVKDILSTTSKVDDYVRLNPNRWGYGKFDAFAGMKKVLEMASSELINGDNNIRIYPNPTSDVVNIDIPSAKEMIEIDIFDIAGRNVYHDTSVCRNIHVGALLSTGLYAIRIKTKDKVYSSRLIVKK